MFGLWVLEQVASQNNSWYIKIPKFDELYFWAAVGVTNLCLQSMCKMEVVVLLVVCEIGGSATCIHYSEAQILPE